MATIFVLLFLISTPLLIIGLIKPAWFSKIAKRDLSRKVIGSTLGGLMVASFIMIAVTAEPVANKVENDQSQNEAKQDVISDETQSADSLEGNTEEASSEESSEETKEVKEDTTTAKQETVSAAAKVVPLVQTTPTPKVAAPTQSVAPTPAPVTSAPTASSGVVKKSTSGICHAPGTTYYSRTLNFTSYNSVQACLNSGGRLPLN